MVSNCLVYIGQKFNLKVSNCLVYTSQKLNVKVSNCLVCMSQKLNLKVSNCLEFVKPSIVSAWLKNFPTFLSKRNTYTHTHV